MKTKNIEAHDLYSGIKVFRDGGVVAHESSRIKVESLVEITRVDRLSRRVRVSFADGATCEFPASYTFRVPA